MFIIATAKVNTGDLGLLVLKNMFMLYVNYNFISHIEYRYLLLQISFNQFPAGGLGQSYKYGMVKFRILNIS